MERLRPVAFAIAVVLVLGTLAGLLSSCGPSESNEAATPGYKDEERRPDDSPFEMAEPEDRGPTTIPDGFFNGTSTPNVPPTPTSTPPPSTTTTAQPPYELPTNVTSICGMTRSIKSLLPKTQPSDALVRKTLDGLLPNLEAYIRLSPPEVVGDVTFIRDMVRELDRLFTEGGNTVVYPPVLAIITSINTLSPPYQDLGERMARIEVAEQSACSSAQ